MAKTELTLQIEKYLSTYKPNRYAGFEINQMRGRIKAFEVPVTIGTIRDGMIDHVVICEYFANVGLIEACRYRELGVEQKERLGELCEKTENKFVLSEECYGTLVQVDEKNVWLEDGSCMRVDANGNKLKNNCMLLANVQSGYPAIMAVCMEIKISYSDFKSANGHNFIGNANYYVIPSELYHKVQDEVPSDIGIITYANYSFKKRRECEFKQLTDEQQKWLILSTAKANNRGR